MSTRAKSCCDLMNMWVSDPSSPIGQSADDGQYVLTVNRETGFPLAYCPFCGTQLRTEVAGARGRVCRHYHELAGLPDSPVKFYPAYDEFALFGTGGLVIRLFFCLLCGARIEQSSDVEGCFSTIDDEVPLLESRIKGITSFDEVLRQLGKPDLYDDSGAIGEFYPNGVRVCVGCKRIAFYTNLARTVFLSVEETFQGKVEIRIMQKR